MFILAYGDSLEKRIDMTRGELIINLKNVNSEIAILSKFKVDPNTGTTKIRDYESGITKENVSKIKEVFGKDVKYIDAVLIELGARRLISEITLRRNDGSEEKRKPTNEENEMLTKVINTFHSEDEFIAPGKDIGPFLESLRDVKVDGKVINPGTGESRPMTDKEIEKFLEELLRFLLGN